MSTVFLTLVTLIAFAANSVLCRWALADNSIDPLSFSLIRVVSGAITLILIYWVVNRSKQKTAGGESIQPTTWKGNPISIGALLVYMFGFSYAYVALGAGLGALILFVMVQLTMVVAHLIQARGMSLLEWVGCAIAISGLVILLWPDNQQHALDFKAALLMMLAGIGWGCYTLAGRKVNDPLHATMINFSYAGLASLVLLIFVSFNEVMSDSMFMDSSGVTYALLSGVFASAMGYTLWYQVVKKLSTLTASVAQLSVPIIATLGGVVFLSEPITLQFVIASGIIFVGIAAVIFAPKNS
ncbi:DMT family transporter [Vibrio fortis]|uniref:DMT family transporter n=1 Tax=Vibrio fortis TaxID=212667 RepID=A0A5N3R653_9VIBR|nr:DMT family transporter [Vibrio fortis]KAB0289311.1 DMT family transporter [Vibrio fortis]